MSRKYALVIGGGLCGKGPEPRCSLDDGGVGVAIFQGLEAHVRTHRPDGWELPKGRATRMADTQSHIVTKADLQEFLSIDPSVKGARVLVLAVSAPLLNEGPQLEEVYASVRRGPEGRKGTFLVLVDREAAESGNSLHSQYVEALHLLKKTSANLVLSGDGDRWMVVAPEEARYHVGPFKDALDGLVQMIHARAEATFTRSTVVGTEADLVRLDDPRVPGNLREVVEHCIEAGAYKTFRGVTAGHFAIKLGEGRFLTSIRKRDFNRHREEPILVEVEAEGLERVVAHGARPSVGGQSQRIVFDEHPGTDSIVHFHSPLRPNAPDAINFRDQRLAECGSHQCGANTSAGLREHVGGSGRVKAVMRDNHGPNIVFGRETPAAEVIAFIERNFDLSQKTGGLGT